MKKINLFIQYMIQNWITNMVTGLFICAISAGFSWYLDSVSIVLSTIGLIAVIIGAIGGLIWLQNLR